MASTRKVAPKLARHIWFYVAVALGVASGGVALLLSPGIAVLTGANVFFGAYIGLTYLQLHKLSPDYLKAHAVEEDAPAPLILLVMVAAVAVAVLSLFVALAQGTEADVLGIVLGTLSVVLGWLAVHTVWAMHYAFEYYDVPEASGGKGKRGPVVGGLAFPGQDEPDGTAFLYFSYVVGMTAQTSDTDVTSNAMRKIVVLHSVFSFFFNTVIVAAAVNIVVSLGS